MRIRTTNPNLRALYLEDLMENHYDQPGVSFAETGTAQVAAEVGERLIEEYDDFERIEPPNSADQS